MKHLTHITLIYSDGSVESYPVGQAAAALQTAAVQSAPAGTGSARVRQILSVMRLTLQEIGQLGITETDDARIPHVFSQAVKQTAADLGITVQSINQSLTRAVGIETLDVWLGVIRQTVGGDPSGMTALLLKCPAVRSRITDETLVQDFCKEMHLL